MKWMTKSSMILALAIMVLAGLATAMPGKAESAQDGIKSPLGKLASINSISVSGEGDAAELIIKLTSPATYTSYKTTAPLRLVLDLSQATQGLINAPLVFNKGNIKTVTATRFDTDAGVLTRVDIELNIDAEAVISASASKPGELRISFPALATVSDVAAPAKPIVVTAKPVVPVDNTESVSSLPVAAPIVQPAIATRKLTSVSVANESIVLAVEGGAGEFKTFRLNKPERFVIDLMDTQIALPSRIIPLNSAGVASARIGLYPDKVRVVLDSVSGSFPEAIAAKSDQGLTVLLNVKPNENLHTKLVSTRTEKTAEVAMPSPAPQPAQEKVAEQRSPIAAEKPEPTKSVTKTENTGPASVEMIDFQVVDGISRVAVKVRGDVSVGQPIKTPGFVTLTIKNAGLPKSLQRSLEARSFISPVLRITPLLIKTKKGYDTKIRIAMRVSAFFEFRQEGDMLFVDFKNPEGLTSDKVSADMYDTNARAPMAAKAATTRESDLASELSPASDSSVKPYDSSRSYKGRKVTLEFADADVRKIFQLLSEVSNKNFVLGDDVTGTISIKLVNVPWDQALDIILDTKGLDKREDGNIIIIKGKGKFKSQAEEEQELKKALTKSIELKAEIFNINYSDVGSIVTQLTNLKTDRGTIAQDARTSKIIVKDIPQALDDMRKLISQLDVPEKQVMIEARIVEATSTFTRSLGVNWGLHYRDGSASFLGINQLDTSFGGVASTPAPTSGLSGNSGGAMGISFGTLTSNISLDLRLNAAASAGLVKIVSTPKVATLNNKTAKITQGQQVPYTSSTSDKVETKFVEAALALEVTPHINANGTIVLKIDAKNDSVGQATGGSTAPAINKKQATTEMLLRDGETTVIGGIYIDSDNESDDGVPYLMDIPFLGKLFKSTSKTKVKTELLIFITPRILNSI
ncbi:MAG: type IV pilus secretin PilQ [Chitinophagaceae bacterium]|nr:type IV pilus secretin PilQ [Chitinophagaceae bacterium]